MMKDIERKFAALERQLQILETRARQAWVLPPSASAIPSYLWVVQGGNTITSIGRQGIALPSPFAAINPSTLPNGPSGTGIVLVPAYPVPVGLPDGIGVIFKGGDTNNASNYAFLRIDVATSAYIRSDLISGEPVFLLPTTTNLDKVSGGTTWRYVCHSLRFGGYN